MTLKRERRRSKAGSGDQEAGERTKKRENLFFPKKDFFFDVTVLEGESPEEAVRRWEMRVGAGDGGVCYTPPVDVNYFVSPMGSGGVGEGEEGGGRGGGGGSLSGGRGWERFGGELSESERAGVLEQVEEEVVQVLMRDDAV